MNRYFEGQITVRQFIEAIPDAMVVVSSDGHIVLTNTRAEQLFGYVGGELLGRPVESLLPPRLRERHNGHRLNYFSAPYVGRMGTGLGFCGLRKDGTELAIDIRLNPIETDSGLFAATAVRKVTEDKQKDAAPQGPDERPDLAQKVDAVKPLVGGIAHQFNNFLSIIIGYSELALRELHPGSTLSSKIAKIHEAARQAAAVTSHIVAFSQQQVLRPTVLDLNRLVADTEKLKRLVGNEIKLVTRLAPDLALVKVDPGQIEQVIQALVRNACDAMPQGGTLTIETANIELDDVRLCQPAAVPAGQYVTLAIKDTGYGIAPETQLRIFEPFFTTKPLGQGVGLELSSAYGAVAQSEGSMCVESEPGRGSTFTVYLPRVVAHGTVGSDMAHLPQQAGPATILLVEDEDAVRGLFRLMLQSAGYVVLEARRGLEAIQISRSQPDAIPLLVTDVMMPGMSGKALAEILLRERPGMKVLYMSGYGGDAVIRDDVQSPQTAFLQKPFSREALLREVQKLLDGLAAP